MFFLQEKCKRAKTHEGWLKFSYLFMVRYKKILFLETKNVKFKGSEQFMTRHHEDSRPTNLAAATDFENKKDEEKTETPNQNC